MGATSGWLSIPDASTVHEPSFGCTSTTAISICRTTVHAKVEGILVESDEWLQKQPKYSNPDMHQKASSGEVSEYALQALQNVIVESVLRTVVCGRRSYTVQPRR